MARRSALFALLCTFTTTAIAGCVSDIEPTPPVLAHPGDGTDDSVAEYDAESLLGFTLVDDNGGGGNALVGLGSLIVYIAGTAYEGTVKSIEVSGGAVRVAVYLHNRRVRLAAAEALRLNANFMYQGQACPALSTQAFNRLGRRYTNCLRSTRDIPHCQGRTFAEAKLAAGCELAGGGEACSQNEYLVSQTGEGNDLGVLVTARRDGECRANIEDYNRTFWNESRHGFCTRVTQAPSCDPATHREHRKMVKGWCGQKNQGAHLNCLDASAGDPFHSYAPRSGTCKLTGEAARKKATAGRQCSAARQRETAECFPNGNKGHADAIRNADARAAECERCAQQGGGGGGGGDGQPPGESALFVCNADHYESALRNAAHHAPDAGLRLSERIPRRNVKENNRCNPGVFEFDKPAEEVVLVSVKDTRPLAPFRSSDGRTDLFGLPNRFPRCAFVQAAAHPEELTLERLRSLCTK
jgi:hypothetical protein